MKRFLLLMSGILCLCLLLQSDVVARMDMAQSWDEVQGVVKDTSNHPIIGASVVAGLASHNPATEEITFYPTTMGTITDFDGLFSMRAPLGCNALQISFIGHKTQYVGISYGMPINVILEEDDSW